MGRLILSELAPWDGSTPSSRAWAEGFRTLTIIARYASDGEQAHGGARLRGLVGQCALEKKRKILLTTPAGYLRSIGSATGAAQQLVLRWVETR